MISFSPRFPERIPERAARAACVAALAALLAACGGGSDGNAGSGDGTATAGTGTGTGGTGTGTGAGTGSATTLSTCGLGDFSQRLLQRINQLRAAGADCGSGGSFAATGAVSWNAALTQAADAHSKDMATSGSFSHTGSDGSTLSSRIDAAGYAWSTIGENIAAGYASVDAVMNGWIASPGHCANLMNPRFTEVGVACVNGGSGAAYPTYWTMDLARPR